MCFGLINDAKNKETDFWPVSMVGIPGFSIVAIGKLVLITCEG